jgi:signal transduction histidine kinase
MLLISALAGYFISHRALRPVVRLTESARSITIGNLAARLPVSPAGDELAQLAETCNEMLSRLEEAVKRITQFTADASHELRSPISFIRTTSEYALRTPGLDAETTEAFENIVSETEHSSSLLEDMLLLARTDAGRAQIVYEQVYMAEIVREVVARMRVVAKEKRQRIVERLPDARLQLSGDAMLLRRLVWILVDNAVKYTPCEGRIEVALVRNEQRALFTVSDNGIGIPETSLPHIFDRFFRVDASRGEQEGTGLGLAIGKWIAEAHRATITARSIDQAGTTFEVAFPLNGNP